MTGSNDRRVCAWDPSTGELVYELAAQQGSRVKDIAFCTASARAAIVLFDSSVAVWDLTTGAGGGCVRKCRCFRLDQPKLWVVPRLCW